MAECIICGNSSFESIDHICITLESTHTLLKKNKLINAQISQILTRIHNHYKTLITKLKNECKEDEKRIHRILTKFEYSHLSNISIQVISNIVSKSEGSFPDRRVLPLLENIESISQPSRFSQSGLKTTILKYLDSFNSEDILKKLKEVLFQITQNLLGPLLDVEERHTVNVRKDSQEEISKKDWIDFRIANIEFSSNTKQILLSNKRITDKDIVDNIDMLKKLKCSGIELRNNSITQFSCKIIAFNLNQLSKIDIRGNKVKDVGIIILAKHNLNLKEFFVSETDITDISAQVIAQKLGLLELIWAENNRLTFVGAQMLINHQKLKVINLEGNVINNEEAESLRMKFNRGFISV